MVLEGTVSHSQIERDFVFVSKIPQVVGMVVAQLRYHCDKLLGKCFDDGSLKAEIEKNGGIDVSLELVNVRQHGKLSASSERGTRPIYLAVEIASGRGHGELEAAYRVKVSSLNEGRYRFSISFVYETSRGEKRRIGNPIDIEVEVRKPLRIERFTLLPSVDYYVLGDPVEALLKISSEYSGTISVSCGGALKGQATTHRISRGPQELRLSLTVAHPTRRAELTIRIPELEYEELVEESVNIEKQRVLIESVEIEKPEIGKKAFVTVGLVNMSKISDSLVHIKADIYGHRLEQSDVLKPMQRKSLVIKTPVLSIDARKYLKGTILLIDKVTGEELTKTIDLPSPAHIPIKIELASKERIVRIPSSGAGRIQLHVSNESDIDVAIDLQKISLDLCDISMNKITVPPLAYEFINLELKPKSVGKREVELNFMILADGTLVDIHPVKIHVEVYRAFDIESIRVLSPSKTDHAVKGQEVEAEIVLKAYSDWMNISIESPDISIGSLVHRAYPPKTAIKISGKVISYVDGIRVSISDGVVRDYIKIPIKVEKPSVDYKITPTIVHVGVRKSLVLSLKNRFEVPLNTVVELSGGGSVEFKNNIVNLELGPLGEEKVDLEIAKIEIGHHEISLKIVSGFIDPQDKKFADKWEKIDTIKIEAVSPIAVSTSRLPDSLILPHSEEKLESVVTPLNFNIYVESLTDEVASDVSLKFKEDRDLAISINPSSMIVKPRSKERVSVVALIPASYSYKDVNLTLVPIVGGYKLPELKVSVAINRLAFSIVEISKFKFIEDMCAYPRLTRGDNVYVLIPTTIREVDVCGEPSTISIKRFEVIRTMHDILTKNLSPHKNPWSAAASIVFKKVVQVNADFSDEQGFLNIISSRREDVVVVPEVLWFLTLSKLLGVKISSSYITVLHNAETVGSLYVPDSSLYKSRSVVYDRIVRFILGKDSGESLYGFILSYVKSGKVDPILLLYVLNGGKRIPFDKELAEELLRKKRFDDYLAYLAITDIQLANNLDVLQVLHKLAETASGVKKNSSILALAILYGRIIQESIDMLKRG